MTHEGYRNGETPEYGTCPVCGEYIRTDRADLAREHNYLCPPPELTRAEREALEHAANGLSLDESADALYVSTETLRSRRKTAIRKVAARNLTHAVAITIRNGTISMPWPARGRTQKPEPETFDDLRKRARKLADTARQQRKENPWTSST